MSKNRSSLSKRPVDQPTRLNYRQRRASRQNVVNGVVLLDTGQAHVEPLVFDRQTLVIDSKALQDRGVQIVHVNWILGDVVTKIVRRAVNEARLYPSASHPDAEAAGMVIAAVVFFGELALTINCAAKFSAPNHERIF
jgi:hypothetical protein